MFLRTTSLIRRVVEAGDRGKLPTCCGVYAIVNLFNGRAYIGSTVNIRKRNAMHLSHLRSGRHSNRLLQADYLTFGESAFVSGVLCPCEPEDRMYLELRLTQQILGPLCYNWSGHGQRSRTWGHPALRGIVEPEPYRFAA